MSERLLVPAQRTALADWRTLLQRAVHADAEAAMRLSVQGDVLVLTVAPLHPAGLGDTMPLVLGMRTLRLQNPALDGLDVVVEARALLDRFARLEEPRPLDLLEQGSGLVDGSMPDTAGAASSGPVPGIDVPPAEVRVPWAGIAPPRGPWEPVGTVSASSLRAAADTGIEEIATGAPEGSGGHAVDALRRRVWARTALEVASTQDGPSPASVPVVAGAAFGAHVLGFLPQSGQATLLRSGPWTRLTLPGGHILVR